jgi:hypothetical protein
MNGDQPAGDLLSASLIRRSDGRLRRATRWLGIILTLFAGGPSEASHTTDVVVRWRADGRELLRVSSGTSSEANQLLAYINAQLDELSVERFCERWGVRVQPPS